MSKEPTPPPSGIHKPPPPPPPPPRRGHGHGQPGIPINQAHYATYIEGCRLTSRFGRNLSAAARAAGMSASYLHLIEGGDLLPPPQQYVTLLTLYGTVPPVVCACGRDLRQGDGSPNARRAREDRDG